VSAPTDDRLVVGLVRGLHGLRGAVRVEVLSDDPDRFVRGRVVHVEGSPDPLTVTWSRRDGPGILVRFREVPTREEAEPLRDAYLEADAPATPLPEGTFWWHQVEGARVVTLDGRELGTVAEVFRAGGGEVFTVRGGPLGEVLVPAVSAVVRELSPADGRIVVDSEALGLDEAPAVRRPRGRRTTRAIKAARSGGSPEDASPASRPPGTPPEGSPPDGPR
jgi:16S rRNA processing protein RimM